MSEVLKNSYEYIEKSKVALLITIGEGKEPFARPIGAFSSQGADIYFLTQKVTDKVKQIKANPIVTFYFEDQGQSYDTFKSLAVTGEASELLQGIEFDKAVEGISVRYPVIKEVIAKGEFGSSAIFKVKAKFVKLVDYTKSPKEVIENI